MGGLRWIAENWIVMLNAIGVVGGLLFAAFAVRAEARIRRIANLLTITTNHREIWVELYDRPELARCQGQISRVTAMVVLEVAGSDP